MPVPPAATAFTLRTVDELEVEGERELAAVALCADLKEVLRRARYRFRVMPPGSAHRWDRAVLLNLTFWSPPDQGDVLLDEPIPADVLAHVAWHHLCERALRQPGAPSPESLFLGEAIASAFDLYLVGRLLPIAPEAAFLESQLPRLEETAAEAGLGEQAFAALLSDVAAAPERAFEDLRQLLFDATLRLYRCRSADEGLAALDSLAGHRLAPLLHRFELSNWVLHARVHAAPGAVPDAAALALDAAMRRAEDSLTLLDEAWIAPRLRRVR
jgi:hypothetical protein